MIIDAHCHAGKGDGLTGPWDTNAPIKRYLQRAAAAGIARTVILPPFHSDYAIANATIGRLVAAHRRRFIGFAAVHPRRDAGRVMALLVESVEVHSLSGVKVHRHDGRLTREVLEAAGFLGLPILYDPMGEVRPLELISQEYPDVPIVIPHLGSFADDWQAQKTTIDLISRQPSLYADTSGVRRFDLLVEAVDRAGPEKLIFGSDGPWLHPAVELTKVRYLGLSQADLSLILGRNLLQLLQRAERREPERPPDVAKGFQEKAQAETAAADPWLNAGEESSR